MVYHIQKISNDVFDLNLQKILRENQQPHVKYNTESSSFAVIAVDKDNNVLYSGSAVLLKNSNDGHKYFLTVSHVGNPSFSGRKFIKFILIDHKGRYYGVAQYVNIPYHYKNPFYRDNVVVLQLITKTPELRDNGVLVNQNAPGKSFLLSAYTPFGVSQGDSGSGVYSDNTIIGISGNAIDFRNEETTTINVYSGFLSHYYHTSVYDKITVSSHNYLLAVPIFRNKNIYNFLKNNNDLAQSPINNLYGSGYPKLSNVYYKYSNIIPLSAIPNVARNSIISGIINISQQKERDIKSNINISNYLLKK